MSNTDFFFPKSTYLNRRKKLLESIGTGQILLLANEESSINFKDNWYHFRQDSCFLYYIGINLPDLAVIIDCDLGETWLFGDDASIDEIIWIGNQSSLQSLGERVGIDKVFPRKELQHKLSQAAKYLPPYRASQLVFLKSIFGIEGLQPSTELILAIVQQRNKKSEEELVELDKAVSLTAKMHQQVILAARAGMREHELVAVASQVAWTEGAHWSFPPIMTINGQTLHNHYYGNLLQEGNMVLFDGGIELTSGYCGDMTRTFPVGKSFTSLQNELYTIAHQAYLDARAAARPGISFKEVHLLACTSIARGLIALGWMKGDAEEAVAVGAHTMFFQCGLGHMMGLDVHDMENLGEEYVGYDAQITKSKEFGLKSLRLGRKLEEGYVITIEPGIYVIPELIDKFYAEGKYKDFMNYEVLNKHRDVGGIRIEDDFVVTSTGIRQLGTPLPTALESIEKMRN